MKIGKLVRKYEGSTRSHKCYSSCALIFIAGTSRILFRELGLHRPYLASAPQARETVEKQVPLMLSSVKSYIAEMGITDNFYQQMVNTDPSQMVIYRGNDITSIVPELDPLHSEIYTARAARRFGITTSEMRQRDHDANNCFKKAAAPLVLSRVKICSGALWWGLSERIYIERQAKSERECQLSAEEAKTLVTTRRSLSSELPFVIRQETCARNIMLGH